MLLSDDSAYSDMTIRSSSLVSIIILKLMAGAFVGASGLTPFQANVSQASCTGKSSIASNFNGTPIAGGDYIWFNSVMKLKSPDIVPSCDWGPVKVRSN